MSGNASPQVTNRSGSKYPSVQKRKSTNLPNTEKKIGEDEFMAAAIGDVEWLKQSIRGNRGVINYDKNVSNWYFKMLMSGGHIHHPPPPPPPKNPIFSFLPFHKFQKVFFKDKEAHQLTLSHSHRQSYWLQPCAYGSIIYPPPLLNTYKYIHYLIING